MTPDKRRSRRRLIQRIVHHHSIPRACEPATRVNDPRNVRTTTKDTWRSLAITTPAGASFFVLLPVAELTTAIPVAGSIFMLTALVTNWFVPHATMREMYLEDVRQGFWFVQRPGPMSTVTEVIAVGRDDTWVKLALRDGNAYSGEPKEKVWIAALRDPYKHWRRHLLATTSFLPRDLSGVKQIVTAVVALRQHGDVCTCPTDRKQLTNWAKQVGLADLHALLNDAVVFGMLHEQDDKIELTDAGRVLLEAQPTTEHLPEPIVNQSRGEATINNSSGSTIIFQTLPQAEYLKSTLCDSRIVRKLLDEIAANHKIIERTVSKSDVGQVGAQTEVLNDAISSGTLHTPKVKTALCTLRDIARQLPSGILSSAIVEVLKHLFA